MTYGHVLAQEPLPYSRIFHSFEDVTITGEGLQIFSYTWHQIEQWAFFNVSHLLRHGRHIIMIISEDPQLSHLLLSAWQWSCH